MVESLQTAEYRVGRFTLRPRRQLLEGDAPVAIGRKALDLLSTLAEAEGALVTKDELMAAVWPQVTVEENAIQVHVAALRKVLGGDADLLSTVRGLGYRLNTTRDARPRSPDPPLPPPNGFALDGSGSQTRRSAGLRRVALVGGALAIIAAVVWGVCARLRAPPAPTEVIVAVAPFEAHGSNAALREFSEGLAETIKGALANSRVEVSSAPASAAPRAADVVGRREASKADFQLSGAVWVTAAGYKVQAHLDDARRNVVVWSDAFEGAASAPGALQASVAAHLADAALWAGIGRSGRVRLDPAALAAFIAGREATIGVRGDAAALIDYRKVAAAAPDFSWGHSGIAVADGFDVVDQASASSDPLQRADARQEARRALALDPHNGEAYLALELVTPRLEWREREALLLRGATADPGFEPVAMMEGRLLWGVGRTRDATRWLELAHDLDRLHNGATWSLALNLASEGLASKSEALLAQMMSQWPDHASTQDAQFWTSVVAKPPEETLALLADSAARPRDMDSAEAQAWRTALKAVITTDPAAKAHAAATVLAAVNVGSMGHGVATLLLTSLGDLDASFEQAQGYRPFSPYAPPYLFLPQNAPMRADRRFMPLARKLGLVDYWRSTGEWPDFCSEPGLPYDCRSEASN